MGLDFYRKVHVAPYMHPVQEGVYAKTAKSKCGAPDVSLTFFLQLQHISTEDANTPNTY